MNKNILVKLTSIAAATSLLVGVAFAAFTSSQVTITGVSIASATPALEVYTTTSGWQVSTADLGVTETNMYPGWTGGDHSFYLRNKTGGGVPFDRVIANLPSASPDWAALKDVVQMQFRDVSDSVDSSWYTLAEWNAGSANILGSSDLADGDAGQREFLVRFKMLPSAGDGARGKNLSLTLGFIGWTP